LIARTLNVYVELRVNDDTTIGEAALEAYLVPQPVTTAYDIIFPPPIHEGAVKVTEAQREVPNVAVPIVGALGTFRASYPGKLIPA
jgi:hypothetical protein